MGHHHDHRARFAGPQNTGFPGFTGPMGSTERVRRQHGGRGRRGGGPWGEFADWGRGMGAGTGGGRGRPGPPPWLAGIFGAGQPPEQRRGPRVRRGDVRSAILDVLAAAGTAGGPINGYQVIQEIAARSGDAWRPSPGSVYPTIQMLQDEGLVEADDDRARKTLSLTTEGQTYVAEHAAELAAVWAPFEQEQQPEDSAGGIGDVKNEIGQVMSAVWQIVTSGSEAQQRAAIGALVDTRRRLYGILADGDDSRSADEGLDEVEGADQDGEPSEHS